MVSAGPAGSGGADRDWRVRPGGVWRRELPVGAQRAGGPDASAPGAPCERRELGHPARRVEMDPGEGTGLQGFGGRNLVKGLDYKVSEADVRPGDPALELRFALTWDKEALHFHADVVDTPPDRKRGV